MPGQHLVMFTCASSSFMHCTSTYNIILQVLKRLARQGGRQTYMYCIHTIYIYTIIHICQYTSTCQGVLFEPHTEWWYGFSHLVPVCLRSWRFNPPKKSSSLPSKQGSSKGRGIQVHTANMCILNIHHSTVFYVYNKSTNKGLHMHSVPKLVAWWHPHTQENNSL